MNLLIHLEIKMYKYTPGGLEGLLEFVLYEKLTNLIKALKTLGFFRKVCRFYLYRSRVRHHIEQKPPIYFSSIAYTGKVCEQTYKPPNL